MPAVADVRRARRPGARHLQRLPGAARGRAAAGRDAAQPRPASSTASTCTCASSRPTRRSRARRAPGQVLRMPDRARRGQLLRGAARSSRELEAIAAASSSATATRAGEVDRRGQSERLARQHRRHLQRARNVVGLMPHPERACERVARQRRRARRCSSRSSTSLDARGRVPAPA